MYFDLSDVTVKPLHDNDAHLAYEEFKIGHDLIERDDITVLGAFWNDFLIGVLPIHNRSSNCSDLFELQVIPLFRNHGIGTMLVIKAEFFCKEAHCQYMRCEINDDMDGFKAIMRILTSLDWSNKGINYNYFRILISDTANTFIARHSEDPDEIHISGLLFKSFSHTSPNDWHTIENHLTEIHPSLRPIRNSPDVLSDLSLTLLKDECVIGWVSVTARNEEEICVENIYVSEAYRENGYGFIMLEVLSWKIKHYSSLNLKYISLYTDSADNSIKKMYRLLFGQSIEKCVTYYIMEKEI